MGEQRTSRLLKQHEVAKVGLHLLQHCRQYENDGVTWDGVAKRLTEETGISVSKRNVSTLLKSFKVPWTPKRTWSKKGSGHCDETIGQLCQFCQTLAKEFSISLPPLVAAAADLYTKQKSEDDFNQGLPG